MSQLTLTSEEQALVASALRAKSAQYLGMFGVADPAIDALLAKVESQLPAPVVVEEPAAVAAFMDDVPHEQVTHAEDQAEE